MRVDSRGTSGTPAARQSTLRDHNLGIVLRALAQEGELSRAGLAQRTGLTRATVSRLVQELLDAHLVLERGSDGPSGPGRPATPVALSHERFVGIGLEVNVDYVAGRAITLDGSVLAEFRESHEAATTDPTETFEILARHLDGLLAGLPDRTVVGQILGIPGLVDAHTETVLVAPNLGWRNVRPAEAIGHELSVMNDVNAQGYAAAYERPGKSRANGTFLYVSGDVGIGAALMFDGELEHGRHGWAAELGHVTIEPNGPLCGCGSRGCLERYAGKRAILDAAGLPAAASPADLIERLDAGDPAAHTAVGRAGWALGIAISDAINLLDISDIILGTGLSPLLPHLHETIMAELNYRPLAAEFMTCTVTAAASDPAPCTTGAALLALNRLLANPSAYL